MICLDSWLPLKIVILSLCLTFNAMSRVTVSTLWWPDDVIKLYLCLRSRPWRGSSCREHCRQFRIAPSDRGTGRGCHRRLRRVRERGQHWVLPRVLILPVLISNAYFFAEGLDLQLRERLALENVWYLPIKVRVIKSRCWFHLNYINQSNQIIAVGKSN